MVRCLFCTEKKESKMQTVCTFQSMFRANIINPIRACALYFCSNLRDICPIDTVMTDE